MPKSKKSNWKKISSQVIHQNPWWKLRHDRVIRPNGKRGDYFYVAGVNSVSVIAVDARKQILLVGQNRYPTGGVYSWEIVTGGIRPKENALAAAKRELREEAGVVARHWRSLGYYYPYNGVSAEKSYCYLAGDLKFTKAQPDDTENITMKWIPESKIRTMIQKNILNDGMSLAALHQYFLRTRKYKEL